MVRGGAFHNNHRNVRCAYRNRNNPNNRWDNGGFHNHRNVRCAYRNRNNPNNRWDNGGFRVALSTFFSTPEFPGGVSNHPSGPRRKMAEPASRPRPGSCPAGHTPTAPPPGLRPWGGAILPRLRHRVFDRLTSWQNLLSAFKKASQGKRGHPNVAAFEHRLEDHLAALRSALRDRTYRPAPYTSFTIHEPKRRLISAADFRDRVVHHALCNVIEPVFERRFVADSYANREGKGTHRALDRCQALARRYSHVLQVDLRQFFPSIDLAILRRVLARKLDDPGVLWLIDRVLESGEGVLSEAYDMVYFPGDDLFSALRPRGLPIGNLTSQFWANVYLDPIDQFIKRQLRCRGYARFVDDLVLFADGKRRLWEWKRALEERLARFRVTIHPGSHPRPVGEGVPFLGFVVFPDRRRLKRRKGLHYRRRLRGMVAALEAGELPAEALAESVRGWFNHLRYANTVGLRRAVLRSLPPPVRELLVSGSEPVNSPLNL